ncbi:MFS transporter, partial [Streptomyces sp. SID7804]|nr:MFS transporter [Streptomyces sp. SID7804]
AAQNDVPAAELGAATSVLSFFRSMGGTIGTSVLGAILANRVATETAKGMETAGIPAGGGAGGSAHGVPDMSTLPEPVRAIIEHAYGVATADLFLIATPCALLALITVVFLKEKPLKTTSGMERLA